MPFVPAPHVMLVLVAAALVAGVFGLRRRQLLLRAQLSACPACGRRASVAPDFASGCLVASCQERTCGAVRRHPVRASALSLFGVWEVVTATGAGAAAVSLASRLGVRRTALLVVVLLAFVVAGIAASMAVRLLATAGARLPLLLQEELVAHLAPPPFLRRRT